MVGVPVVRKLQLLAKVGLGSRLSVDLILGYRKFHQMATFGSPESSLALVSMLGRAQSLTFLRR
jgi:hypothetical protein